MAEPFKLESELTPKGKEDLEWLRNTLGKHRVAGPSPVEGEVSFRVELTRSDGRHVWMYGRTAELALAATVKTVLEGAPKNRRRIA